MSLASVVNSMIEKPSSDGAKERVLAVISAMRIHQRRPRPRLLIQELDEEGVSVDDKAKEN